MAAFLTLPPLRFTPGPNLHPGLNRGASALRAQGVGEVSNNVKDFRHIILLRNSDKPAIPGMIKPACPEFVNNKPNLLRSINLIPEGSLHRKCVHAVAQDIILPDKFLGSSFNHFYHSYLYAVIVYIPTYPPTNSKGVNVNN